MRKKDNNKNDHKRKPLLLSSDFADKKSVKVLEKEVDNAKNNKKHAYENANSVLHSLYKKGSRDKALKNRYIKVSTFWWQRMLIKLLWSVWIEILAMLMFAMWLTISAALSTNI